MLCDVCKTDNPNTSKFCGECGTRLMEDDAPGPLPAFTEQKKQVTVFFADLSGFTAMSEKLDAEEVKEIMRKVFSASTACVNKYGGRVDKFIGDCVMAVFGIPQANEDDAVRAIHAAMEIHDSVDALNKSELESKIGRKLSMHTGINSGMVVAGDLDMEKGSEKIIGDTVNVASRLSGVAKRGEIVVGRETFALADWHFQFQELPPVAVKGKAESLRPYKLIGHKKTAETFRGLRGRKAEFIGRERELGELDAAIAGVASGKVAVVSVSGDAGTGKSRLVSEFKSRIAAIGDYNWREAFAYPNSINIAYSVWIDFIGRLLSIEESDSKEMVRKKLEGAGIYCAGEVVVPYIAALYSIVYPETKGIDPGYLKMNISRSIIRLVGAIARSGKTVFAFEDLHWADPSSLEILGKLFQDLEDPALFLCVHRPGIPSGREPGFGKESIVFKELTLPPLGSVNEERMIASLLDSDRAPPELTRYLLKKISGTPFYIEEIINNLIETKVLTRENGTWKLTRDLTETDIPLSIQGVITARIDRLDPTAKRVLQTASVIGQSFYYSLLKPILELSGELDDCIELLESIDVIREETREPDIAYLFKHALLRDVVYNSLLKKERGTIHQRVAELMEAVFKDRIEEFYETIAFHYQKSGAQDKAVEYLVKAGGKSMASYASREANGFYQQAYDILTGTPNRDDEENGLLIRLLNDWGFTHYCLGTYRDWVNTFKKHIRDAESIHDRGACALFYAELGYAADYVLETDLSLKYQYEALRVAEEAGEKKALAYAHCWLATTCGTRGRAEEGIAHGDAGMKLAREIPEEPYLFAKSGFGKSYCLALRGNRAEAIAIAHEILEFGEKRKNSRCLSLAYMSYAHSEYYAGNGDKAIEYYRKSAEVAIEPFYKNVMLPNLALALIEMSRFDEAEAVIGGCEAYFRETGYLFDTLIITGCGALLLFSKSHEYAKAFAKIIELKTIYEKTGWASILAKMHFIIGSVYWEMLSGGGKTQLSVLLKNLPFIIGNLPFAYGRAVKHFQKSRDIAKEGGIYSVHGQTALKLGILAKMRKKTEIAKSSLNEAITELEKTDLAEDLEKARAELRTI